MSSLANPYAAADAGSLGLPAPAPEKSSKPTQEQLDRWTAAYAVADAGSLGAPAAAAQETADAAARLYPGEFGFLSGS